MKPELNRAELNSIFFIISYTFFFFSDCASFLNNVKKKKKKSSIQILSICRREKTTADIQHRNF